MNKLDDDNNTDSSFFEITQITLDLASAENMLANFINSFNALFGNRWGPHNEAHAEPECSVLSLSHVLLSCWSHYFQLIIPLFFICGVADVKMVTGVVSLLSTGSASPSKHLLLHLNFLFLEEVALVEATFNIIIAGKSDA